jgi:hypothetical protein
MYAFAGSFCVGKYGSGGIWLLVSGCILPPELQPTARTKTIKQKTEIIRFMICLLEVNSLKQFLRI